MTQVECKLYPGMRHELVNEIGREEDGCRPFKMDFKYSPVAGQSFLENAVLGFICRLSGRMRGEYEENRDCSNDVIDGDCSIQHRCTGSVQRRDRRRECADAGTAADRDRAAKSISDEDFAKLLDFVKKKSGTQASWITQRISKLRSAREKRSSAFPLTRARERRLLLRCSS